MLDSGASLGDILNAALAETTKEKQMTKVDLTLEVIMNGKKINAVKAVREFTGMGLTESKAYVENYEYQEHPIRLNMEQFGKLMLVKAEADEDSGPIFHVRNVKRSTTQDFSDFSGNV